MAKNNYLNPEILPRRGDVSPQDHHKLINGALIAAFAASIIGFAYWWSVRGDIAPPVVVDEKTKTIEEQFKIIRESGVTVSETEKIQQLEKLKNQLKVQ